MTYRALQLSVESGLADFVLDQPDNGNAFGDAFCSTIGRLRNELVGRGDVRAVLLRSRGRYFSVGTDLEQLFRDIDAAPEVVRCGKTSRGSCAWMHP